MPGAAAPAVLARFIREREADILHSWQQSVQEVSQVRRLAQPLLVDHIPTLLERIAEQLDAAAGGRVPLLPESAATRHADTRLRAGIDLAQVVKEYGLLRDCLLRLWRAQDARLDDTEALRILNRAIDTAVETAADCYGTARDEAVQALGRLSVASHTSEGDGFLNTALQILMASTGSVEAAVILLKEADSLRLRAATGAQAAVISGVSVPLGAGLAGRAAQKRQPVLERSDGGDFDLLGLAQEPPRQRMIYSVPLLGEDERALGVIEVAGRQDVELSVQDRRLVDALADHVASALTQQGLRRQLQGVAEIVEHGDPMFVLDRDWRFVMGNRAYETVTQTPRDNLFGRVLWDVFPATADPNSKYWIEYHRAMEERVTVYFEEYYPPLDLWTDVTAHPTQEGGIAVFFRDVTEKKRIQAELSVSEQRFRHIVDSTHDYAIYMLDIQGRITTWNVGAERINGYSAEEILGTPAAALHPLEARAAGVPEALLAKAEREGRSENEGWRLRKGGSRFWANTVTSAICDEQDRLTGFAKITRDLTSRKRREDALRLLDRANQELATLLDVEQALQRLADLVAAGAADWCAIDLLRDDGNTELAAVAHREPEKAQLARDLRRRFPVDSRDRAIVRRVIQTGEAELVPSLSDEVLRVMIANDEYFEIVRTLGLRSVMAVPLIARGRTLGAITFASADPDRTYSELDLTFAKELSGRAATAVDNARLYEQAQRAVKLREDVLAIVSHDLKSPLSAISLSATFLQRQAAGDGDAREQPLLESIQRASRQMERLIGDLLDMASIQAGQLAVAQDPHPAAALLSEAAAFHQPLGTEKGLELNARLDLDPRLHVCCDRARILQVLGNLLGNAMKFTPPGGCIELRAAAEGEYIRVSVSDSGPGIAPEELGHIFDPYWSGHGHRRMGTGLGLFISKGIVNAHRGEIGVDSTLGKGSTFFFTLPILREDSRSLS
jgi:PAS domain S-box-containing protein